MSQNSKTRISKFKVLLFVYVLASAYPAYVQTAEWTNAALDAFAAERMGITVEAAKTYDCVARSMDGHPATEMGE